MKQAETEAQEQGVKQYLRKARAVVRGAQRALREAQAELLKIEGDPDLRWPEESWAPQLALKHSIAILDRTSNDVSEYLERNEE